MEDHSVGHAQVPIRTLGLIGGCGAISTGIYYERINQLVRAARPGHGAKLLLWSFDVEDIDVCCRTGDWPRALAQFRHAASWLQAGGVEAVLLCTNTMHRIADSLCESLSVPLVNIIDETAAALRSNGHERPILLGTRFTMQEAFYRDRLERRGLNVLLPSVDEQRVVHALIYDELMLGQVTRSGRVTLANIIARLAGEGADSVILGCTELGLSIRPGDVALSVYDTAEVHCQAAIAFALGGEVLAHRGGIGSIGPVEALMAPHRNAPAVK